MTLGILETGKVNPALVETHGLYPPMFKRLLGAADPDLEFDVVAVIDGAPLPAVDACDAWLVTGSKFGVYDPEPWIAPLKDFLRRAYAAGVPLIGVCFGHQLMADALGGRAEKFSGGWSVGRQRYELVGDAPFGAEASLDGALTLHAFHQDQVTAPPPDAKVLARSEACAYAALAYGEPAAPQAISVQAHPEFDAAYTRDLALLRRGVGLPEDVADRAIAELGGDVQSAEIARWMARFLKQAARRGQRK